MHVYMCVTLQESKAFSVTYRNFLSACSTHDVRLTTPKSSTRAALGTSLPAEDHEINHKNRLRKSEVDPRHDVLIRLFPLALLKQRRLDTRH